MLRSGPGQNGKPKPVRQPPDPEELERATATARERGAPPPATSRQRFATTAGIWILIAAGCVAALVGLWLKQPWWGVGALAVAVLLAFVFAYSRPAAY